MATVDIKTEITGNVWKIVTKVGDEIEEDEPIPEHPIPELFKWVRTSWKYYPKRVQFES